MAEASTRQPEDAESGGEHVCPVAFCPVGMFLSLSERARPEAVEHLLAAGREFMMALAAVINARVDDLDRSPSIEKIELE
jgi:hypothetical protein